MPEGLIGPPERTKMSEAVQAYDWESSPLGPTESWPPSLRINMATMLATAIPSFIVWGPSLTLIYNDAYVELLAGRHPGALGRSFQDVWPEIWSDLEPLVRRTYSGESLSQQNLPLRMQRKGYPEDTWFTYFYTPIRLDDGAVGGFLCGCIENTEPMRAGRELEAANTQLIQEINQQRSAHHLVSQSEARYRALFEAIDDGFCIIEFFDGPHGRLSDYIHVEANAGYQRHTGIPNIVGRTVRDLVPAEADGWVELYAQVLRTGEPLHFEREFTAVQRVIEVSASRIEPASRRQVSVLFRDITERKRAEVALRNSEALARENVQRVQLALAAGAIIGTWFWDLPTDRFTFDEAFARSFGLDPALGSQGVSLERVVETVHPDDQAGLASAIQEAITRGGPYAHQYRVKRADGKYYWLEANGRVEQGGDGTPLRFPGVLIDIEERRALIDERDRAIAALRALNETLEQRIAESKAELLRSEEQLRQSQKMEAVN